MRYPWMWTSRGVLVGALLNAQVTVSAEDKGIVTARGGAHDPRHVQGAFGLLDARLGLRTGAWDLSVWGENLTDETYVYQSAVTNLFGSDPAYQNYLAPGLSFGATARIQF